MFRYCRWHCSLLHKFTSVYPKDACSGFILRVSLLYPVYYEISGLQHIIWTLEIKISRSLVVNFCEWWILSTKSASNYDCKEVKLCISNYALKKSARENDNSLSRVIYRCIKKLCQMENFMYTFVKFGISFCKQRWVVTGFRVHPGEKS